MGRRGRRAAGHQRLPQPHPPTGTGLGGRTADEFVRTIRTGRHRGSGRPLLPPMPWRWAAKYGDDDLKAIFAYLQSIPAIRNRLPDPVPAAPPAPPAMK